MHTHLHTHTDPLLTLSVLKNVQPTRLIASTFLWVCVQVFGLCVCLLPAYSCHCVGYKGTFPEMMLPSALPSVSLFQLRISSCVMACVMLKSCTDVYLWQPRFSSHSKRKHLKKIRLDAFCFAVDYRICLYSNATETLTKTEFCVLLYKYSWMKFKSVSSETAEAQKNKQRNIKLTVSISFVVVPQYSFQWKALWVSTKSHKAMLWSASCPLERLWEHLLYN